MEVDGSVTFGVFDLNSAVSSLVAVTDEEFPTETCGLGGFYRSEGCICTTSAHSLEFVPVLPLFFSRLPLRLNKPTVTNDLHASVLLFELALLRQTGQRNHQTSHVGCFQTPLPHQRLQEVRVSHHTPETATVRLSEPGPEASGPSDPFAVAHPQEISNVLALNA